jgi:hypothetical protein
MKNSNVSIIEERQFITKEFAATLAGKLPAPYLRLHDPVQRGLVDLAATLQGRSLGETAYLDRMIHFWREVSLAGLPRAGTSQDECHALLFESAFDLAEAEPEWALECLAERSTSKSSISAGELAHQIAGLEIGHSSIVAALTRLHAPMRESDPQKWSNELTIAFVGDVLFWNAMLCAVGIDEHHRLWPFRCALAQSSHNGWGDRHRLHARLIRESPQRASKSPRAQLMAHPILRLARLKYREGSVEQKQVLRFLNARCIKEGFESEEDYFGSDLTLAQWARDARQWATTMLEAEPEACEEVFHEAGEKAVERTRIFYRQHLGSDPVNVDPLDATAALIKWAKHCRGFAFSQYRAQLWEFVVEIADAALWLGWLFPARKTRLTGRKRL